MDIDNILKTFMQIEEKNIFITNSKGEQLYESKTTDIPSAAIWNRIKNLPSDFDEQEFMDKKNDLYFSLKKTIVEAEGEEYYCYRATDISEYTKLIKEVASYAKTIADMTKFQTYIMENISTSYDAFLPGLAEYCGTNNVLMYMDKGGTMLKSYCHNGQTVTKTCTPEECEDYFKLKQNGSIDGFFCVINSSIQNQRYVVLVKGVNSPNKLADTTVHSIINLFIEKSILRDKVIYESEHDSLTGLYNKRKYLEMKSNNFGSPNSIAIYNFDVNNLKYINDHFGHELGDKLIINAAKSISAVCQENVFGFRMGGDEYIMVAVNITEEEAKKIKDDWQAALTKINDENGVLYVAIACGMIYSSGDFNYNGLYTQSDNLMYAEKKELKKKGISSFVILEKMG